MLLHFQLLDDAVNLEWDFGNQRGIGSSRQCGVHGDLPAISAHHFDEEETFSRVGRVADLVDRFGGGADGRRKADANVGAREVVVYRSRATDDRSIPVTGKLHAATERPVSADGDQVVDSMSTQDHGCGFQSFLRPESLTAAGV